MKKLLIVSVKADKICSFYIEPIWVSTKFRFEFYSKYMEIQEDSTLGIIASFCLGSVTSTSGYAGNLTFFGSGVKTVTATLTNTCTNESKTISQQVIVN